MVARNPAAKTTAAKAAEWENLNPLLQSMYREFQELAKKKPDGVLSETKIKMVNRLLSAVHKVLQDEPNAMYLDLVDEDNVPQNSDVMLILGQTVAAMQAFRSNYHGWNGIEHLWFT